jgi:hypothetical protein
MSKKINDGGRSGLKMDKFRNSRFEEDWTQDEDPHFGGVSRKTSSTISGPYQENRGRRNADEKVSSRWVGPFENGRISNWKRRHDWDQYFDRSYDRGNRPFGGGQLDHEGSHFGKGPKGYQRPDESIYEDVCYLLLLSRDVDASSIEVQVKEGVVYLIGEVQDRQTKRLAELEIEMVSGVKDVQNQLTLKSRSDQRLH